MFLIIFAIFTVSSTPSLRFNYSTDSQVEQIIINIIILIIIFGFIILAYLSTRLTDNLHINFSNEIETLITKYDPIIKKNNLHILRATARNITTIQTYIIAGFTTIMSIYLPSMFDSMLILLAFYAILCILDIFIIIQMKRTCILAITQTKLEE